MAVETLVIFALTCVVLALTPGPNMSLIVASTLAGGFRSGLVTLAGTATGLAILTAVATAGMSSVMILMAEWFDVIRLVGAAYLLILGVLALRAWWRRGEGSARAEPTSASASYLSGLLIALSNPKVLLFLGAFFPQFVDPTRDPALQLAILGTVFVATLLATDVCYTLAVARARRSLDQKTLAHMDAAAGGLMMAGGLFLLAARR